MSAVVRAVIVILFLTPFVGCDPAAASLEDRVENATLSDTHWTYQRDCNQTVRIGGAKQ